MTHENIKPLNQINFIVFTISFCKNIKKLINCIILHINCNFIYTNIFYTLFKRVQLVYIYIYLIISYYIEFAYLVILY